MPPRHISPQSFDDILSELGDDPAIPDPHGIRKTPSPPRADKTPPNKNPKPSFSSQSFELKGLTFNPLWIFLGSLLLLGGALFFYLDANKSGAELEISTLQSQLFALRDELELSRQEWVKERDDLYEEIDEIEVSIHSIKMTPPIQATQVKSAVTPYEVELRQWRYLGLAQMGATEQAFFHTGKTTRMVVKDELALGEWRLTQAVKELAILTHPKGKSLTFKSTQSE